jgi:predicted metal-dependent phosphotriesterase family hydrolase
VAPERITGTTLIHEHLSFGSPGKSNFTDDLALMAEEVKASAADGIRCIVDAGTQGLGRKIDSLRAIATQSGMLIVACGGLHRKSDYPADAMRKSGGLSRACKEREMGSDWRDGHRARRSHGPR